MIVDEELCHRQHKGECKRQQIEERRCRKDYPSPDGVQSGMYDAARVAIRALVGDLPVALEGEIKQQMFDLQTEKDRQKRSKTDCHGLKESKGIAAWTGETMALLHSTPRRRRSRKQSSSSKLR